MLFRSDLAMSLALEAVPICRNPRQPSAIWRHLLASAPPENTSAGTGGETPEAKARQEKCRELTRICLEQLDGADKGIASMAGWDCVNSATVVLYSKQVERFLPHCQEMLAGTLRRATELGMGTTMARATHLGVYAKAMQRCHASAEDMAGFRQAVQSAFPGDPDIERLTASLEAKTNP